MWCIWILCGVVLGNRGLQDPEVPAGGAEWRKALDGWVKDEKDRQAVDQIGRWIRCFPELAPADQKASVDAVLKCLNARREPEDTMLALVVVEALATLGEAGADASRDALKKRMVKENPPVLGPALEALARHRRERDLEILLEHLVHTDASVVAASVRALAEFHESPDALRKELAAELIKNYNSIYSNSLPTPQNKREPNQPMRRPDEARLKATRDSFESSLQKLTGAKVEGAQEWQRWYNDHKRKRWSRG